MKEQFCNYDIALKLKELGFDEPCIAFFNTSSITSLCFCDVFGFVIEHEGDEYIKNSDEYKVAAPMWQQTIDWFREKHGLIIYISTYQKDKHLIGVFTYDGSELTELGEWIPTYEEAREQAILRAIELIKNK
jgi:hypothetical protein